MVYGGSSSSISAEKDKQIIAPEPIVRGIPMCKKWVVMIRSLIHWLLRRVPRGFSLLPKADRLQLANLSNKKTAGRLTETLFLLFPTPSVKHQPSNKPSPTNFQEACSADTAAGYRATSNAAAAYHGAPRKESSQERLRTSSRQAACQHVLNTQGG